MQRLLGTNVPSSWAFLRGLQSHEFGLEAGGGVALGPLQGGLVPGSRPLFPGKFWRPSCSCALIPCQAQLIHDRNTASHSVVATRTQAPPTPDKVQMTWTKEKLAAEKFKNKEPGASGFKDLFSLKP